MKWRELFQELQSLTKDFQILDQFKDVKNMLPPISYISCFELEVMLKEMFDFKIISEECWKQVERLGRTKY